jgi:hypothetical protein
LESGDGVGAYDLGGNEEVDAIDHAGREEGGVEAGSSFGEDGKNACLSKFVEECGKGNPALFCRENLDADAAGAKFVDAGFGRRYGKDDDVVLRAADDFAIERRAQGGIEDDAEERASAAKAAAVREHGVVGEDGVDAGEYGIGLMA